MIPSELSKMKQTIFFFTHLGGIIMNYCKNCGTKLNCNEKFCPKCGASLDTEEVGSIPQKPASIVNQTESIVPSSNQPIMQNQTYGNPSASFISPDVQNTVYVAQLEKMSLLSLFLLSIVTLGFYGLYYPIRLEKDVSSMLGRHTTSSGFQIVLFSIFSFGIYQIWFFNKMAAALDEAMDKRHMIGDRIGSGAGCVIMLLIPLVGLLALYKIINAHNSIIDFDRYAMMANQSK